MFGRGKKKRKVPHNKNWKRDLWNKGPKYGGSYTKQNTKFVRVKVPKGGRVLDVTRIPKKGVMVTMRKPVRPSPAPKPPASILKKSRGGGKRANKRTTKGKAR